MMLTGLSGNEIYCLAQKGWVPGNIVVGNSVYSLGFVGGFASGLRTLAGGEVENVTHLISDGRHAAIKRLEDEANQEGAHGLTGVVSELTLRQRADRVPRHRLGHSRAGVPRAVFFDRLLRPRPVLPARFRV